MKFLLYYLAVLVPVVMGISVVTVSLAQWLSSRSYVGRAAAVIMSGGVVALALLVLLLAYVGEGFLEQPGEPVRLANSSNRTIVLVQPTSFPTDRTSARYRSIEPGGYSPLFTSEPNAEYRGSCTLPGHNRIVQLPEDYRFVRYKHPDLAQIVDEDPDPALVIPLAQIPPGWCFSELSAWIEWNGSSFTETNDPRLDPKAKAAIISAVLIGLVNGFGLVVDRRRAKTQQLVPGPITSTGLV